MPYRPPRRAAGELIDVLIPEDTFETVAFVCQETERDGVVEHRPIGTAFVVSVPSDTSPSLSSDYFITARHVVENLASNTLYLRINTVDGHCEDIPTACHDWTIHDDADVATILFNPPSGKRSQLNVRRIPTSHFVTSPGYVFRTPAGVGSDSIQMQ